MSAHALSVLEFDRVLDRIADRAASEPGRRRVRALRPQADPERARQALARVAAVLHFVDVRPDWGMPSVPDVGGPLAKLAVPGSVLEAGELHQIGVLIMSSRTLARDLDRVPEAVSALPSLRAALVELEGLQKELERAVDADGHVLDAASRELRRIRDRLKGAHGRVVKRLEAYLGGLAERYVVPDASVTLREGRYVIPVRREARREIRGIVHDESQTGATLYVEPPEAIEAMNELRDLEREEHREVRRVLAELTRALHPEAPSLQGALDALADFDSLHARARVAVAWRGHVPELSTDGRGGVRIVGGRHPLLVETHGYAAVVPFDLELGPEERAVVVSGPNTGGKSVFLKATGLIAALAQSGVVPPVGPGTRLPVFSSFYADIGDEQSIAHNLSTFSAHLANLSEIVAGANERSLVLVDEMGTGTDPAEGAALARSVLEALVERGALTLASSHLGALKRLDGEGTGIVNASLQFDPEQMEPTYRLLKGRPGRSYGLAIARRLGFPGPVLDRAEGYLDDDEARLEEMLARLEAREREAEELVHELENARARAERLRVDVEARERALREAETAHDTRAREDARKLLLGARAEVEEAIRTLRATAERDTATLDAAAHDARRRVEQAAERAREGGRRSGGRGDGSGERGRLAVREAGAPPFGVGDRVRLRATGAKGRIAECRADRALVEIGALRMEVSLADLEAVEGGSPAGGMRRGSAAVRAEGADERASGGWRGGVAPSVEVASASRGGGWSGPTPEGARLEVDLRGLRVHELEIALSRALDDAVYEDLSELRIIHGKGTGALRQRVTEILGTDRRVRMVRMGGPTEGGAGVTVAGFREPE